MTTNISNTDHIILFSLLFLIFFLWGKYTCDVKNDKIFWLLAIIPIASYSLIVGSRYMWGVDYIVYKSIYELPFIEQETQVAFTWLNNGLIALGFNYVGAFIVYSLIFIMGVLLFLRDYGKSAKYMYAFVVPFTMAFATTFIRQGVALGFGFMALHFFQSRKWLWMLFFVITALSIHFAVVIILIPLCLIYFFVKRPLNWKITIPAYLFFALLFDVNKITFIANYIQVLPIPSLFSHYLENADQWFGQDAIQEQWNQTTFALIMSSMFNVFIIYLGFVALKLRPQKQVTYIYNAMVIGMIVVRAVFNIELLRRTVTPFEMLSFIVLGYILYCYKKREINPIKLTKKGLGVITLPILLQDCMLVGIFFYIILYYGRFLLLNPDAMFFWNH